MLHKIGKARQMIEERGVKIDVYIDKDINSNTASLVAKMGANVLIAGSAIFGRLHVNQVI